MEICNVILIYHPKVFKEEEDSIKVDLHEGCGRSKLYWITALADSKTLKAMVEFKQTSAGITEILQKMLGNDSCM